VNVAILVIVVLIAVVLILGRMKSTAPAQPPKEPAKRPAPDYLGSLGLQEPWYGFGQRIVASFGPETHGCTPGVGAPKQTHGIVDNETGPYYVRMSATDMRTGAQMRVYLFDSIAGAEVTGQWVRLTDRVRALCFYALGKRPWGAIGSLVGCNKFVPIDEYAGLVTEPVAGEEAIKPLACNPGPSPSTPNPSKPTTTVRVEVQVRNADGAESIVYQYNLVVETSSCS